MIILLPSQGKAINEPITVPAITPKLQTVIKDVSYAPVGGLETVFISKLRPYGTYSNSYAPYNCTSYVASRLPIPNSWGNAASWSYSAMLDGYKVSSAPDVGTIATNTTDSYLGHVGIVAEIANGMVRLEEDNYAGPGVITTDRWAPIGAYVYIYV